MGMQNQLLQKVSSFCSKMSRHVPDISDIDEDITPRRISRQQTRDKRTRRYKPVMFVNIIHVKENFFYLFTSTFLTPEPELNHLHGSSLGTPHLCALHWHALLQKPTPPAEVNLTNSLSFQKFSRIRGISTIFGLLWLQIDVQRERLKDF